MKKDENRKIKVESEWDWEYRLSEMVNQGLLKESFDNKRGDLVYSLQQKGVEEAKNILRTNRIARLFLIQADMNLQGNNFHDSLLRMAKFMKKTLGINLFQDVVDGVKNNELEGIQIEDEKAFIDFYDKI